MTLWMREEPKEEEMATKSLEIHQDVEYKSQSRMSYKASNFLHPNCFLLFLFLLPNLSPFSGLASCWPLLKPAFYLALMKTPIKQGPLLWEAIQYLFGISLMKGGGKSLRLTGAFSFYGGEDHAERNG